MKHRAAGLLLLALAALPLRAEPLPKDRVPGPLQPWTEWAMRGHESELCPSFLGAEDGTQCVWPGRLALDLGEKGGRFSQEWTVEVAGMVALPGDAERWPLEVTVDGQPAAVVSIAADDDLPGLRLTPGRHTVAGVFHWDSLPESLPVPSDIGLVALTVRGAAVPFPERGEAGEVLLQRAQSAPSEQESLEIHVHRKIVDEVPLQLITRIDLAVSGKAREVLLGRALPDRFLPLAMDAPIPARLEPDGRLRVQARPGTWTLTLTARHAGPAAALALPAPGGPWAAEEVWAFEARPALRLVNVEGIAAVDPQQTDLPDDWKGLPAYRLRPGETLRLAERRRGDADPAPDKLALHRVLWLDFDGGGYTWQDQITGTLTRSWRLEMAPSAELQRVVLGDRDQVITRRPGAQGAGVEVRQGQLAMSAEGRINGCFTLPGVAWDHDFQEVSGQLNLPPGWRIVAALGVDDVPGTWVGRWTLLDLFLVLIIALAIRHLWGNRWGLLALAALVLTWQEAEAPRWIWLMVLAAAALLRYLPDNRFRSFIRLLSAAALIGLVLIGVAFLVRQLRQAIYPALEHSGVEAGGLEGGAFFGVAKAVPEPQAVREETQNEAAPPPPPPPPPPQSPAPILSKPAFKRVPVPASPAPETSASGSYSPDFFQDVDPRAVVSTGPGLPAWAWNQVPLRWSGPVEKGQTIHFVLLSPAANLLLALVRTALLALLILRALGVKNLPPLGRRPPPVPPTAVAILLAVLSTAFLAPPAARAAEVPPDDVLEKLRAALTEKPPCHPNCAAAGRLFVDASPAVLRLRFEVGAAAAVAVPVPGGADQWHPAEIQVDGAPAGAVRGEDGSFWVRVGPGRHEILLSGPLPPRDVVQIPLPLKPHFAAASGGASGGASGWTIDGIHEDGQVDDTLQLSRVRAAGAGGPEAGRALQPGELPPFLEVERTLRLGLTWQVETRVRRLSPPGTPAVAAVPLLAGESVTTAGIRVQKGQVLVNLGPQTGETAWSSTLAPRPEIVLAAPQTLAWTEVWHLEASPLWHFEAHGIPAVQTPEGAAVRTPEWHPWPGESVRLAISRPAGIPGQSLTIDRSTLAATPGLRSTEVKLDLALRSSRGGRHTVILPEQAELTAVTVDGQAQPLRQEGRKVDLPVHPGAQQIALGWREPHGASLFFRSPRPDLQTPSVNALVTVEVPASRWVLLVGGPRLGPAVLFWSVLLVIVLVAAGLGRLPLTPLSTRDWALLGIGLSQIPLTAGAVVAGWLLALGLRRTRGAEVRRNNTFNLLQILLAAWTLLAVGLLFWAIQQGLLGTPDMQIEGNGSSGAQLRWYTDRAAPLLPAGWMLSVPILVYRLAMLAWALWLALAFLRWLRWGWDSITTGGGWRPWQWTARWPRRREQEKKEEVSPS